MKRLRVATQAAALSPQDSPIDAELDELRRSHGAVTAERDLLRQRLELAEAEMQILRDEAQEMARSREWLFSSLAHELRTPLQTLTLNVEMSLRRYGGTADDVPAAWMTDRLQRMRTGLHRLHRLCDTFLSTAALAKGALEPCPESVDLRELVGEVIDRMAADLRWAGCEVTVDAEGPVVGSWDPLHLHVIVASLLENAMKYGAGRPITVSLTQTAAGEGEGGAPQVELEVRDAGVGISREDSLRVFEPYTRLEPPSRVSGFGLGLWLVRELSSALGGRVWVSQPGGPGAVLTVRLPLQPH